MATALQMIDSALSKIGVLGAGESASDDSNVSDRCLKRFNALLDAWSAQGLTGYTTTNTTFTLPGATTSRTIGTSMQINVARPVSIKPSFGTVSSVDYRIDPVGEDEYNAIALKSTQAGVCPVVCFFDGGAPTGNVYFWPPSSSDVSITLVTTNVLAAAATTAASYDLPQGAQRAFELALAIDLASDFNVDIPARLVNEAANARRVYRRSFSVVPQLRISDSSRTAGTSYTDIVYGIS